MKAHEVASDEADNRIDTDDLFEMANLLPGTTGLPLTVWVSPRGNLSDNIRVKVNLTHGNQMNLSNMAVVGVRPSPHIIAGNLSPDDEKAVFQWISLNAAALLAYWEGEIDTIQLGHALKMLTTSRAS